MTGCLGNHQRQEQTVAKIQHGSLYRERGKKKKKKPGTLAHGRGNCKNSAYKQEECQEERP